VEEQKPKKTLNLRWNRLDQDDKEIILKVIQENPAWARILLYGETRLGSEEENEALLRHNDGLFDALFIRTADATVRMRRYDNTVIRLFVPNHQLRRAWESEEEYLGLSGLDDSMDFIHAIYCRIMARTEEHVCYPYQRFGAPSLAWPEEDFNTRYLGGWMVFKKTFLLDVSLTRFFAKLPRYWFANIALRKLDDKELALALSVARKGRVSLTNGELRALSTFEQNSRRIVEQEGEGHANSFGAWRGVL
jgi:hypothetical protein